MSATSRSCPNMLLSHNIQQKWLMWILQEDCVFSHMLCTCLTEYTTMKTPKLKHSTSMQAVYGKSQEENVNLYCP